MGTTVKGMVLTILLGAAGTATAGDPAVGDEGGAYGGDTTGRTGTMSFATADRNGDGSISRAEARAAGIERFEAADSNGDGRLERAEFAALEGARTRHVPPGKDARDGNRP